MHKVGISRLPAPQSGTKNRVPLFHTTATLDRPWLFPTFAADPAMTTHLTQHAQTTLVHLQDGTGRGIERMAVCAGKWSPSTCRPVLQPPNQPSSDRPLIEQQQQQCTSTPRFILRRSAAPLRSRA
ncbi:hypothetical protein PTSG_12678 [Salpingoeca rosetta]|uniref:Uncharacterized protein n=1 Tax=Salpingoeca rosetta (strain ATCC 50818 / BSB-021) TaxID=946362 RepID=F2UHX4_SALR5|nr:uncharacterized protein PTSG_12678 [Salpingoeca rosetta]EGD76723.1 hypothetical protein PTSG_12678 [Salpingoeca rosetta]|eukprot:XP_004991095.1 hypothetical protein PTSG_12678 [Salpingoeca rosetta]